jgi:mono/diheme cytochrome c family protein
MKFISLAFIALLFAATARAADVENGNDLHFTNCTGCHDSSVYTRENRRVGDLAQLGKQVRFCKDTIGVAWFDDEVDDVIEYLNATYYHY